jgi:O-antigen/teichoic acid export membrane protein
MSDDGASGAILARTATAAGWTVGWRMFTRAIGLCSTLILARLLTPADFGLVALATGFASSLDELSQVGVDDALMRIKAPRRALYDAAFTIDMLRGLATAALLLAVARPVAAFFNDPRLADVLFAVAAGTAIVGCHNVGTIDFRRDLQFHKEFRLYVLPRLAQVAVTLALAAVFRSYWALVAGILTGRIGVVLYSYVLHPLRPRPSLSAWRELAGFSAWSWVLSLIALVRDRTDAFFVGRALDARAVGVFSVGMEIGSLPTTELVSPLAAAAFAGFAAARHEGAGAGENWLRVVGAVAAVTVPAGLGVSLLADPLVRLALGLGWLQAIPVIEVAGAVGGLAAFGLISAKLFSAHAYFRPLLGVSTTSMVLRVGLLAALVPRYGVLGAAVAGGMGVSLEHAAYVALACRRFGFSARRFAGATWRTALAACAMAAALRGAGLGWAPHPGGASEQVARLAMGASIGAAVYAAALAGLWLAAGGPRGPETDLATLAGRLLRRRHAVAGD